MNNFPGGVWPVMLTPFTEAGTVDYEVLEKLTEWYIDKGVDGLFAVCQSSEMFELNLEERVKTAEAVCRHVGGRIPVIASGHISETIEEQMLELNCMAKTGLDALILITNRFAREDEDDNVWIKNAETVMAAIPATVKLGLYECPYPYKRILSEKIIKWCVETGRFYFLKDTSCDIENIRMKLDLTRGSILKIYNANTATLLESLREGVCGYSGVMGNMHPELYTLLCHNKTGENEEMLSEFLTISALIERQMYPVNAKYYLQLEGVPIKLYTRVKDASLLNETFRKEVRMLRNLSKRLGSYLESTIKE